MAGRVASGAPKLASDEGGFAIPATRSILYVPPRRMRVGPVVIDPPVILAPMAAVTDLPFRTVCEEHGVGFTITEFLSAHALKAKDPRTHAKMTASLGGRAFGVQIFGREVDAMQQAAQMAVATGADPREYRGPRATRASDRRHGGLPPRSTRSAARPR